MSWTALVGASMRRLLTRRITLLGDNAYWSTNTPAIQIRQLRRLLHRARDTEFGHQHDFPALLRRPDHELIDAYTRATPIATYDDLKPQLERMRRGGETDICWPGLVRDWAQTSGTTAGDKYVPVSRQLLAHNRKASFDIFAHAHRMGVSLTDLFAGRMLFLGGSTDLEENEFGVRTGDLSGIVTQLITWPLTSVYLPGRDIALMSDWPAKIDAMARACLDQDVRLVSGMASWSLVLFERMVELAQQQGRDVTTLEQIWPNLTLFVHGGVRYDPFEHRVRKAWSGSAEGNDVPRRLEVYPASEGFIAMQDTRGDPGLRLNIDHGIFYEFVPVEQIHDATPDVFTCWQVVPDQRYVVVMSTPAGMWRYIIGDVVQFESIPDGSASGSSARLRIVGRHRLFINAFGENIIVEHIENAVVRASKETGHFAGEFTAAPVYPDATRRAGLELIVECDDPSFDPSLFSDAFDRAIKAQNNDYTAKRAGDAGMAPPTITRVPTGTLHDWMASRGKLGGQHKCPRCANNREFVDQILSSVEPSARPT
ncbi:MAG: GH3 auxin-responsive promoter family protein [Phycisphaerales bacterium JB043]